jgi:hypothetical protein
MVISKPSLDSVSSSTIVVGRPAEFSMDIEPRQMLSHVGPRDSSMKRSRRLDCLLALVVCIASAGCVTRPTPIDLLGVWGGPHVSMEITAGGARLEFDCGEGTIDEPIRTAPRGDFAVFGTHTPGRGGPVRIGEILPTFRARYEGNVDGERMTLLVTVVDTGVVLGPFQLRRGNSGLLVRCL